MAYKNCNTYTEAKDELERMVKVNQKLSIEKSVLKERIAELEQELKTYRKAEKAKQELNEILDIRGAS
jgi:regulator of replication initiation timing